MARVMCTCHHGQVRAFSPPHEGSHHLLTAQVCTIPSLHAVSVGFPAEFRMSGAAQYVAFYDWHSIFRAQPCWSVQQCAIPFCDHTIPLGFPGGSVLKGSCLQCRSYRRRGCDPWVGKIPWRRNDNPLQCSCLENPKDGGAWWATVHGVAESWI